MPIVMQQDDLQKLRDALEPLTSKMKGVTDGDSLPLFSIALSLKRIADAAERMAVLQMVKPVTPPPPPTSPTASRSPKR